MKKIKIKFEINELDDNIFDKLTEKVFHLDEAKFTTFLSASASTGQIDVESEFEMRTTLDKIADLCNCLSNLRCEVLTIGVDCG